MAQPVFGRCRLIILVTMLKIALILWLAAVLIGLLAGPKQRPLMGKLAFGGFCLLLLAALIRLLRL